MTNETTNTAATAAEPGATVAPDKASSKKGASQKKGAPKRHKAAKGGQTKATAKKAKTAQKATKTERANASTPRAERAQRQLAELHATRRYRIARLIAAPLDRLRG